VPLAGVARVIGHEQVAAESVGLGERDLAAGEVGVDDCEDVLAFWNLDIDEARPRATQLVCAQTLMKRPLGAAVGIGVEPHSDYAGVDWKGQAALDLELPTFGGPGVFLTQKPPCLCACQALGRDQGGEDERKSCLLNQGRILRIGDTR